jgi:hypothetical protein
MTITGNSQASFTWIYGVTICGSITFSGTASGTDAADGVIMTSAPVSSNEFTCATTTITVTETKTATATETETTTATTGVVPTSTPRPEVTATSTPASTGVLTIGPVKPYPNPINPLAVPYLKIAVDITPTDIDSITLKIYTVAYRLIREQVFEGTEAQEIAVEGILQYNSSNLIGFSDGTYYFVVIAEKGGVKVRSKTDTIIILK